MDPAERMFDRFSARATRVLFHARSEAGQLGSRAIEPEHMLLGVLDEGGGLGSRILASTCDELGHLRTEIVARLTRHEKVPPTDEIEFSTSCKRVLEHTADEAERLSHDHIGTEHLLLGLLHEEHGVAAEVLAARGVKIEAVREAIVELLSHGEQPESPGPPGTPANTYKWPWIPFVPSRMVHILHSGAQWPTPPVINFTGTHFSAFGFTVEDIIVRAWEGSRWHVEIPPALRTGARFDFLMVLPEPEPFASCLALLQPAVEEQFGVHVTRETLVRDIYRLTKTESLGHMLKRYPDPEPGVGFGMLSFSVFRGRPQDAPMFPLDPFAVHSVPVFYLVNWFEEILGGQVIDETHLPGIYGFELKERVDTPERFLQLLREEAGLVIARDQREIPTLVVRQTEAEYESP
jgi:uncharacterized protein (TIGR03435 family)